MQAECGRDAEERQVGAIRAGSMGEVVCDLTIYFFIFIFGCIGSLLLPTAFL